MTEPCACAWQDCDKLRTQIVQSPERIKREIVDMKQLLEEEQQGVVQSERWARDLALRAGSCVCVCVYVLSVYVRGSLPNCVHRYDLLLLCVNPGVFARESTGPQVPLHTHAHTLSPHTVSHTDGHVHSSSCFLANCRHAGANNERSCENQQASSRSGGGNQQETRDRKVSNGGFHQWEMSIYGTSQTRSWKNIFLRD